MFPDSPHRVDALNTPAREWPASRWSSSPRSELGWSPRSSPDRHNLLSDVVKNAVRTSPWRWPSSSRSESGLPPSGRRWPHAVTASLWTPSLSAAISECVLSPPLDSPRSDAVMNGVLLASPMTLCSKISPRAPGEMLQSSPATLQEDRRSLLSMEWSPGLSSRLAWNPPFFSPSPVLHATEMETTRRRSRFPAFPTTFGRSAFYYGGHQGGFASPVSSSVIDRRTRWLWDEGYGSISSSSTRGGALLPPREIHASEEVLKGLGVRLYRILNSESPIVEEHFIEGQRRVRVVGDGLGMKNNKMEVELVAELPLWMGVFFGRSKFDACSSEEAQAALLSASVSITANGTASSRPCASTGGAFKPTWNVRADNCPLLGRVRDRIAENEGTFQLRELKLTEYVPDMPSEGCGGGTIHVDGLLSEGEERDEGQQTDFKIMSKLLGGAFLAFDPIGRHLYIAEYPPGVYLGLTLSASTHLHAAVSIVIQKIGLQYFAMSTPEYQVTFQYTFAVVEGMNVSVVPELRAMLETPTTSTPRPYSSADREDFYRTRSQSLSTVGREKEKQPAREEKEKQQQEKARRVAERAKKEEEEKEKQQQEKARRVAEERKKQVRRIAEYAAEQKKEQGFAAELEKRLEEKARLETEQAAEHAAELEKKLEEKARLETEHAAEHAAELEKKLSWTDARGHEHEVTAKVKELLDSEWRGQTIKGVGARRVMGFFEEEPVFVVTYTDRKKNTIDPGQVRTRLTLKADRSCCHEYAINRINTTKLAGFILKHQRISDDEKLELCSHLGCKDATDWKAKYDGRLRPA